MEEYYGDNKPNKRSVSVRELEIGQWIRMGIYSLQIFNLVISKVRAFPALRKDWSRSGVLLRTLNLNQSLQHLAPKTVILTKNL